MSLPRVEAWTERAIREWFTRCDRCKTWRLVGRYHEFHGQHDGRKWCGVWWRECMDCSFATVAAWGEEWQVSFLKSVEEELEAPQ